MVNEHYRLIIGVVALLVGFYSYVPYLRDIHLRTTKPHAFSWLIWALLMLIGFVGQLSDNGGPGAWVTGLSALISLYIFFLALRFGEKDITRSDWWCLIFSLAAIPIGIIISPLWSILLITVIDFVGCIPTFRKSYLRPFEETLSSYWWHTLKCILGLAALTTYSMTTVLYPASLVLANMGMAVMIMIRRRSCAKANPPSRFALGRQSQ